MSKFIEITDLDNKAVSLNVDYIFKVEPETQDKKVPGTTIKLAVNGYNGYAIQYIETALSYETVMDLIKS